MNKEIQQDPKVSELAERLHQNLLTGYSSTHIVPDVIALDTALQKGILRNTRYLLRRLFQLSLQDIPQTSGASFNRIASYRPKFLRLAGKYWRYFFKDAKSAV